MMHGIFINGHATVYIYRSCDVAAFSIIRITVVISVFVTYLLTYGAQPFLRSCQLCSNSGTSQHFKEPEGLSPCSQEPSIGPYSEPD
jgi:hypothetical protein